MSGIIRKNITNPQRIKECLDNIDIASGHLQSMLSDVLDMSKLESREIELEHVAFSLDEELENVQAIVIGKLQEGNIDLIIRDDQVQHRFLIGSVSIFAEYCSISSAMQSNILKRTDMYRQSFRK